MTAQIPPRPTEHDAAVQEEAARQILPKVRAWLGSDSDGTDEEIVEDLVNALDNAREPDGYRLARELEDEGYDVDAALVEVLDGMHLQHARDTLVRAWVQKHDIKLTLTVGAKVKARLSWARTVEGEISALYPDTATYCVSVLKEGHVRSGLGTHGYIVPCEAVTAV